MEPTSYAPDLAGSYGLSICSPGASQKDSSFSVAAPQDWTWGYQDPVASFANMNAEFGVCLEAALGAETSMSRSWY